MRTLANYTTLLLLGAVGLWLALGGFHPLLGPDTRGYRALLENFGTYILIVVGPVLLVDVIQRIGGEEDPMPLWFVASFVILFAIINFGMNTLTGLWPRILPLAEAELDSSANEPIFTFAHTSDLHLTATSTLEGGLGSTQVFSAAENAIRWGLTHARVIMLTGDLTDSGSSAEWELLEKLLSDLGREERERVLFVPGNHDLTLNTDVMDVGLVQEEKSKAFALQALARVPDTWTVNRAVGRVAVAQVLKSAAWYIELYKRYPPTVTMAGPRGPMVVGYPRELKDAASRRGPGGPWPQPDKYGFDDFLREVYPMRIFEDDKVIVIGLDSNKAWANSMSSSGFGFLGSQQLAALDQMLSETQTKCRVLMLHHHIGVPPRINATLKDGKARIQNRALQLTDAADFQAVLDRHKRITVVFGHLHAGFIARAGDTTLLSAPSTADGDVANPGRPTVSAYAVDNDCRVSVADNNATRP